MKHTLLSQLKHAHFSVNGGTPAGCTPPPERGTACKTRQKKPSTGICCFYSDAPHPRRRRHESVGTRCGDDRRGDEYVVLSPSCTLWMAV